MGQLCLSNDLESDPGSGFEDQKVYKRIVNKVVFNAIKSFQKDLPERENREFFQDAKKLKTIKLTLVTVSHKK
jgi:hypothetical protein